MVCFKISLVLLIVIFVKRSVGITTTELNLAGQELRDLVGKDLKDLIKIPDKNFKKRKLYDISVQSAVLSADYPDVKVSVQGSIIMIELSNFNFEITAKWKVKLKVLIVKLKARGTVTLKTNGVGIKLTLNIDTLNVISCYDWIKELDIKFYSGVRIPGQISRFNERIFKLLINTWIKMILKGKICKAVKRLIDKNRTKISGLLGMTLKPIITPRTTRRPPRTPRPWPTCRPGRPGRPGEPRGLCGPMEPKER